MVSNIIIIKLVEGSLLALGHEHSFPQRSSNVSTSNRACLWMECFWMIQREPLYNYLQYYDVVKWLDSSLFEQVEVGVVNLIKMSLWERCPPLGKVNTFLPIADTFQIGGRLQCNLVNREETLIQVKGVYLWTYASASIGGRLSIKVSAFQVDVFLLHVSSIFFIPFFIPRLPFFYPLSLILSLRLQLV